jgi:hypothetical protein
MGLPSIDQLRDKCQDNPAQGCSVLFQGHGKGRYDLEVVRIHATLPDSQLAGELVHSESAAEAIEAVRQVG